MSIIRYYSQYGTYATLYLRYRIRLGVWIGAFYVIYVGGSALPPKNEIQFGVESTCNLPVSFRRGVYGVVLLLPFRGRPPCCVIGVGLQLCHVIYTVAARLLRLRLLVLPLSVIHQLLLLIVPGLPPWVKKQFGRRQAVYVVISGAPAGSSRPCSQTFIYATLAQLYRCRSQVLAHFSATRSGRRRGSILANQCRLLFNGSLFLPMSF